MFSRIDQSHRVRAVCLWLCCSVTGSYLFILFCVWVQISSAVCFLLSPAASYISGATLRVDAGQSLYHSMWEIPSMYILLTHPHICLDSMYHVLCSILYSTVNSCGVLCVCLQTTAHGLQLQRGRTWML